jgi:L-glutamine-phosphate cytidylyltransferase
VINIKAIILAAGIGSRLGANLPKAMVKIDEHKTILDQELENLKKIVKLEDIVVVVGFKKDLIMKKYRGLSFVYNKDYMKTNTSKSLLTAFEKIDSGDVLWLNGDIVFEPEILKFIAENNAENLICVNNNQVSEEEVKYTLNKEGYVKEISKTVVNGLGEAVGINFIKKEDIKQFISCLKDCENSDYFERGIEFAIGKGVKFLPLDIKDNFCTEVDFQEDLKKVKKFIQGEK